MNCSKTTVKVEVHLNSRISGVQVELSSGVPSSQSFAEPRLKGDYAQELMAKESQRANLAWYGSNLFRLNTCVTGATQKSWSARH